MFLFQSTDVSYSLEVLARNNFNYFGDKKPEGIQDKAFFRDCNLALSYTWAFCGTIIEVHFV